jgi:DivIVA domain-containing protein
VTTVLQYLVIAAVIGLVVFGLVVFVFGRGEQLAPLSPRTSPTELPDHDMAAADVRKVRFAMALRGYRMSDVDWALDKMADEIDRLRDEVARLSGESGGDTHTDDGAPGDGAPGDGVLAGVPAGPHGHLVHEPPSSPTIASSSQRDES